MNHQPSTTHQDHFGRSQRASQLCNEDTAISARKDARSQFQLSLAGAKKVEGAKLWVDKTSGFRER
jgi:hypothetical protein